MSSHAPTGLETGYTILFKLLELDGETEISNRTEAEDTEEGEGEERRCVKDFFALGAQNLVLQGMSKFRIVPAVQEKGLLIVRMMLLVAAKKTAEWMEQSGSGVECPSSVFFEALEAVREDHDDSARVHEIALSLLLLWLDEVQQTKFEHLVHVNQIVSSALRYYSDELCVQLKIMLLTVHLELKFPASCPLQVENLEVCQARFFSWELPAL
eukprot:198715-Rhodomonas_salina.5